MGILPYKVLCNAALCVFHVFLLKVALSKVLDPDIEMKRKSGADGQQRDQKTLVLCSDPFDPLTWTRFSYEISSW